MANCRPSLDKKEQLWSRGTCLSLLSVICASSTRRVIVSERGRAGGRRRSGDPRGGRGQSFSLSCQTPRSVCLMRMERQGFLYSPIRPMPPSPSQVPKVVKLPVIVSAFLPFRLGPYSPLLCLKAQSSEIIFMKVCRWHE